MVESSRTGRGGSLRSVCLKSQFFAGFFLTAFAFGTASQNVPAGTGIYSYLDKLEALGCAYPTFRALGPQAFFDIQSALGKEVSGSGCSAPEWLLDERQLLVRPAWLPEFRSDGFVGPDDLLRFKGMSASLWPLFPQRQNRPTLNGVNLSNELALSMRTGTQTWGYALSATPGFYAGYDIRGVLLGRFYLQEAYVKLGYGFSELLVGRYARRFGDARHGSLLYSGAAAPLDVIEYALRPMVPPGTFSFLGPVSLRTWIGNQGGAELAVPWATFWGLEWGLRPLQAWELAFAQLLQFGGNGANRPGNLTLAASTGIWLPRNRAKLYGQVLLSRVGESGVGPSFLAGLWLPKLWRWDFRAEFVVIAKGAYQHPFWTQGLTYRGSSLGHPLGPDAQGLYFDVGLPPIFTWWHSDVGFLYEVRGLSLQGSEAPEKRYGVALTTGRRFGYSDIEAKAVYHQVHSFGYQSGQIADVFGVGATYRYAF